jgi:hypothetical protein
MSFTASYTICTIMKWAWQIRHFGVRKGVYRVLVGKPKGKKPLGRPRLIWDDNSKLNLQEVECVPKNGLGWLRIEKGGWNL